MLNKPWDTIAKGLAGVGALNWGLAKFANIDLISFIPEGIFVNIGIGLIAVSGAYLLYAVFNKKV